MKLMVAMIMTWAVCQSDELYQIRKLYQKAPLDKTAAKLLDQRMMTIDSNSAPLLYCYKGANEMIQAKYALNPLVKLDKFNKGKSWIVRSLNRDSVDLEMRFIRLSIQRNLPAFLGYRDDIRRDEQFLQLHVRDCQDAELKKMISDYLTKSINN